MKNLILLVAVMVVGACASVPTVKSVAGTYEHTQKDTQRVYERVLLENGIMKDSFRFPKGSIEREKVPYITKSEAKWLIKNKEIHIKSDNGATGILRINPDGSITPIRTIDKDGKISDYTNDSNPFTYIKIK